MEKGINLRMQELDEDIMRAITKAKLPPRVVGMILSEKVEAMKQANNQVVLFEKNTYEKEGAEDGKEIQ